MDFKIKKITVQQNIILFQCQFKKILISKKIYIYFIFSFYVDAKCDKV